MSKGAGTTIPSSEVVRLLTATRAGDKAAFADLLGKVLPDLQKSIDTRLQLCNRPEWADDVCQETVLKLMRMIGSRDGFRRLTRASTSFGAYVSKIARNKVTDRFRSERRRATVKKLKADQVSHRAACEAEYGLDREQALALITILPPELQPLFRLLYIEGRSPAAAATVLKIKKATVYKRDQRGLLYISRKLTQDPKLARRIRGPE